MRVMKRDKNRLIFLGQTRYKHRKAKVNKAIHEPFFSCKYNSVLF